MCGVLGTNLLELLPACGTDLDELLGAPKFLVRVFKPVAV
jgi:hypothetical protein